VGGGLFSKVSCGQSGETKTRSRPYERDGRTTKYDIHDKVTPEIGVPESVAGVLGGRGGEVGAFVRLRENRYRR